VIKSHPKIPVCLVRTSEKRFDPESFREVKDLPVKKRPQGLISPVWAKTRAMGFKRNLRNDGRGETIQIPPWEGIRVQNKRSSPDKKGIKWPKTRKETRKKIAKFAERRRPRVKKTP